MSFVTICHPTSPPLKMLNFPYPGSQGEQPPIGDTELATGTSVLPVDHIPLTQTKPTLNSQAFNHFSPLINKTYPFSHSQHEHDERAEMSHALDAGGGKTKAHEDNLSASTMIISSHLRVLTAYFPPTSSTLGSYCTEAMIIA